MYKRNCKKATSSAASAAQKEVYLLLVQRGKWLWRSPAGCSCPSQCGKSRSDSGSKEAEMKKG